MARNALPHTFVLQELRLRDTADASEAAAIVAASPRGAGPTVPLLTSIDDERDVAVLHAERAGAMPGWAATQRRKLDGLVATWHPAQRYSPRISERTTRLPSHYQLAVTESGITNGATDPPAPLPGAGEGDTRTPLDLLWVGLPLGSYAGLLVLLGTDGEHDPVRPDAHDWPLPLSRYLGVRIYDSRR